MFQLSEFTDKPVGGTQWKVPFIHMQFNFTLSYITLSPRGRTSHSILLSEPDRASYAPKQLNSFLFSPTFHCSGSVSAEFRNKYKSGQGLSPEQCLGK